MRHSPGGVGVQPSRHGGDEVLDTCAEWPEVTSDAGREIGEPFERFGPAGQFTASRQRRLAARSAECRHHDRVTLHADDPLLPGKSVDHLTQEFPGRELAEDAPMTARDDDGVEAVDVADGDGLGPKLAHAGRRQVAVDGGPRTLGCRQKVAERIETNRPFTIAPDDHVCAGGFQIEERDQHFLCHAALPGHQEENAAALTE
jgi:hypothetical protein